MGGWPCWTWAGVGGPAWLVGKDQAPANVPNMTCHGLVQLPLREQDRNLMNEVASYIRELVVWVESSVQCLESSIDRSGRMWEWRVEEWRSGGVGECLSQSPQHCIQAM